MANALVAPYIEGQSTQVVLPLCDPRFERANRTQFIRDNIPELRCANGIFISGGRWPVRAYLLVQRQYLNALLAQGTDPANPYAPLYRTDFQLYLEDFRNAQLVLKNLALAHARCVSRGIAADPKAVYLLELTDARGVVQSPVASWPLVRQYNVLAPAYPGQYYSASQNSGTPWTWGTLLADIWNSMTPLGAFPGLPSTPSGTPTNLIFLGVPAWPALCNQLDRLGLTVGVDLTQSAPYSIVQRGATDAAFTNLTAQFAGAIEEDYEWISAGSARVPGSVTVFFHRQNQYYGTEETLRLDGLQWSSTPLYSVNVTAPARFASSAGSHVLWDDFVVRFDTDGNPLAADVATATTIAQERVSQYYDRVYWDTLGSLKRIYTGLVPFAAGSQVAGVRFYMDMVRGQLSWCTEVIRSAGPPWPEVENKQNR